jgi:hypothetical protein
MSELLTAFIAGYLLHFIINSKRLSRLHKRLIDNHSAYLNEVNALVKNNQALTISLRRLRYYKESKA